MAEAERPWGCIEGLHVSSEMAWAFEQDGITTPTAIQQECIAAILEGRHVVVQSGTGTGKTLAYLLPVLQKLERQPAARAVVLTPSPELALQILRVAERYKSGMVATGALVATASHKQQRARVQKSTRLIVGTPGRVLERYAKRKLKGVTTMVLDEPDPILGGKDAAFLREVMSRPEPKMQIIIVGATLGPNTEALVRELLGRDVVRTQGDPSPLQGQIKHYRVTIQGKEPKDVRVARFIEKNRCRQVLLFVNKSSLIGHLYRYLGEHGLKPVSLSHERPKLEQQKALRAFERGEARVLISTDKAMRGIDIPNITWVLHYELPQSAPAYIHRAGRTGRAGCEGCSVVFCLPKELPLLKRYGRELALEFAPFR